MAVVKDITADTFDETVAGGTVLVDFWAPWCSSCKMLNAVLEQVAATAPADVVIAKVNVDNEAALAAKFEVVSLPKMLIYKDGALVKEFKGVQSRAKIVEALS